MLKIQQEIAKSKARAEVYGKHDAKFINGRSQLSDDKIDLAQRCQPRNIAESSLCHHRSNALQKDNDAIYNIGHDRGHMRTQCLKGQQHANNLRRNNDVNVPEMMCKLVNEQSVPEIDIDVFGGNPLEFHYFMAVFHEAIEKKIEDLHGKLTRLIKYTTGEVKEMVKNYIQLPPKEGYETAKQMMHKLYGDPHKVIAAYRKEIKQWPQIKPGDAEAYRKFHNFLLKCENITQMQTWNVLDTPEIMCMLLSKLPSVTRDKWSRRVLLIRRKQEKEPELADFLDFVNDENLIVNDLVFSKKAVEQYIYKKTKRKITRYKLWRKSPIRWSPEVHGHGFEGQNQLLIKEKVLFWMFAANEATL